MGRAVVVVEVAGLATSGLVVAVLDEVPFMAGLAAEVRLPSGADLGFTSPFTAESKNNSSSFMNLLEMKSSRLR